MSDIKKQNDTFIRDLEKLSPDEIASLREQLISVEAFHEIELQLKKNRCPS